jgi:N-acetylmuramoyl-L-alanine amidase
MIEPKFTVILDPAHGSDTSGKRSPDGKLREYQWSREVCKLLGILLDKEGIKWEKTSYVDYEIGLRARVYHANQIDERAKGKSFFLSLHINASGMGTDWMKARGFSVWTTRGTTKADRCATIIWDKFKEYFPDIPIRKDMVDGDVDYESNFTVLLCRPPAVLVECLFQDNIDDVEILMSDEFKYNYSECLLEAIKEIIEYLK